MSRRLDVLTAVKALVVAALPGAEVKGLDATAGKPDRIPPNGLAIVRAGDPGQPDVDLCPPTYHFAHQIPVELGAYQSTLPSSVVIDTMMGAIGRAIAADRTLGGLCDHLEALAPGTDDVSGAGTAVAAGADLIIVAHYATADPLN